MKGAFIGIDTSNYTTSVALCSEDGEILLNLKKLLPVSEGGRGLRQSDALFHHTVQLPELLHKAGATVSEYKILAVGASERPRDAAGSYMPCFLAGASAACAAAVAAGAEYFDFSHQCGHVAAALYSANRQDLYGDRFAAFHVSGGTTDLLLIGKGSEGRPFDISRVGGTLDINAGQAIDRAGVMMGLGFPCGPEMEKLALENTEKFDRASISVKGLSCNMSGIENRVGKLFEKTGNKSLVAAYVIDFVTRTLEALTKNLLDGYGDIPIVYAGGVMSCSIIKDSLSRFGSFAEPVYSSDNAAGVALLARRKYFNI